MTNLNRDFRLNISILLKGRVRITMLGHFYRTAVRSLRIRMLIKNVIKSIRLCFRIITLLKSLHTTIDFNGSLFGQGAPTNLSAINENVKPYSIMDAHSGLFIEDWVVPEDFWNRSLAGIMGFRYNQFHNPNSTSSRQVRIKAHGANADLHNVNVITTNANVNEGDLIDYSKMVSESRGLSDYEYSF